MSQIHHPHDSLFKNAFGKKVVTKDFLLNRLSPEILANIDIESLQRKNNSFINEQLKAYYSDIVFKVKTKEGDGYLFFLLEHQTKADELIPLRLLEYDVAIMRYDVEQQLKARKGRQQKSIQLPVIINFVVYAGKKYNYPKRLLDAFRTPDLLYRMFEDHFLIHLKEQEDKHINQDGEAALAELLLREGYRKDFCKFLTQHPKIVELLNTSTYAQSAIMYILDRDPHNVDKVLEKFINLAPETKDHMISRLQRFKEEAIQLGLIQGKKEGLKEGEKRIVKRMLANGKSLQEISRDIGLTLSQVKDLIPNK